jgi:ligand-binding sensor domain-containing protein/DNA-binding CsgD family transcriptional regulator
LIVRNIVCLCIALLMLLGVPFAQARSFSPVGATKGLEASVVPSLILDSKGFLWVGSREGLFRYDGYRTQAFIPQRDNINAISDIDIRCIYEAGDGFIWVGTNTGGLDRYDPATGKFRNFRHDSTDPASLLEGSINGIAEGPDGLLWVATAHGLSRLDRGTGSFEHFRHDAGEPTSLSNYLPSALLLGESGRLWIATTGGGVSRWNPGSQDFRHYDLAQLIAGPAKTNHVLAMHEDEDGILWSGTREGLVRLDPQAGQAEYFDLGEQDADSPVITSLKQDRANRLWLTTMVRGLLIVDLDTGAWRRADLDSQGHGDILPQGSLMSLSIGPDQVFVGTWGSGVYRTAIVEDAFELFNMNNAAGLTNNVISAVMATAEDGQPWLGSFGGGPQQADIANGLIRAKPMKLHQMRESGVMSLAGPIEGRLYAGTTQGLYEFSNDGTQVALFEHDPGISGGIGDSPVIALLAAGDSGLWMGMGGSGLHLFDTRAQSFTPFRHDSDNPGSISGNFVTALLEDTRGYIWVGTRSRGLNRCRIDGWTCERFSGRNGTPNGLSHHHVTTLYRDRRGRVWVGTDGGGLNQVLQHQSGNVTGFRHWRSRDGLLNDGIMAIQEDLDESLWLSSRHGLSRLNPVTGHVINFVAASGLPVSHFNTNASSSDDRYIYFGSTGGLLIIPKGSLLTERQAPNVRVTPADWAEPGSGRAVPELSGGRMRLPYKDVLSIELAVLDFAESSNEYAYRLYSSDPWIELGSQRQIVFHGLAPGQYEFQARGRDAYGIWGESEPLSLEIVPPFWMTRWFQVWMSIAFVALVLAFHFARQEVVKRRAGESLRLGEKREQALEEQLGSEAELAVLTPRQKEILQLLAEGYSTRKIAELLGVSVKTVEAHRSNLMERLEIHDVPGLVRLAIRSRLVSLED